MAIRLGYNNLTALANSARRTGSKALQTNMERLSSGLRINKASDDVGKLGVSRKLKSDFRTIMRAKRTANDGVSITQTMDSGMAQIQDVLQDMKQLASRAKSGDISTSERQDLDDRYQDLANELSRIADNTEYNDIDLLDGTLSAVLQVGKDAGDQISLSRDQDLGNIIKLPLGSNPIDGFIGNNDIIFSDFSAGLSNRLSVGKTITLQNQSKTSAPILSNLEITRVESAFFGARLQFSNFSGSIQTWAGNSAGDNIRFLDKDNGPGQIDTQSNASRAIAAVENALDRISQHRAYAGSKENRFQYRVDRLAQSYEDLKSANTRIRDVDAAKENAKKTQNEIKVRAASSMVTQANVVNDIAITLVQDATGLTSG